MAPRGLVVLYPSFGGRSTARWVDAGPGEACSVALSGAFRYLCVKQPFSRYVLILHQKDRPRAGVPCALGLRSSGLRHHAPGAP